MTTQLVNKPTATVNAINKSTNDNVPSTSGVKNEEVNALPKVFLQLKGWNAVPEKSATSAEMDNANKISNLISLFKPNPKCWYRSRVANKNPVLTWEQEKQTWSACTRFQSTVSSQKKSPKTERWKNDYPFEKLKYIEKTVYVRNQLASTRNPVAPRLLPTQTKTFPKPT